MEHRLWVMNAFNSTESKEGVYLYQRDAEGQAIERLTARSASFDSQSQSWKFQLGRQVFSTPKVSRLGLLILKKNNYWAGHTEGITREPKES